MLCVAAQVRAMLPVFGGISGSTRQIWKGTGSSAASSLHRIEEAFAKKDITAHGFVFEKDWPGYRNPADDHSKEVFDASIRGKTDRFAHLYRKQ